MIKISRNLDFDNTRQPEVFWVCVKKNIHLILYHPILFCISEKTRKNIHRRENNNNNISSKHQGRMINTVHGARSLKTRTTSSTCIYANVLFNKIYPSRMMSRLMNSRVLSASLKRDARYFSRKYLE